MKTKLLQMSLVLPSQDIYRDIQWYHDYVGFEMISKDDMYAVLKREELYIHLQWHADTPDDTLLGGSVVKIFVKNIGAIFKEFVERKTVTEDKLILNTAWNTNEFGFYDLNKNAVFFVEDL
ncbi:glyoxalase/bleomycin resistance/extradiol dioxygenase family protein [Gillisia marina]|uniref:glyoxalase/bleomycin resistance/extradiol dioxygenase family protein n=1 Tax=Gillisia marina TaxID=1167637 RepID=UPI00029AC941|nr:glyoxalase/bleomycin resistance/extradiol dioxygenase family protein [Gillisia marina]